MLLRDRLTARSSHPVPPDQQVMSDAVLKIFADARTRLLNLGVPKSRLAFETFASAIDSLYEEGDDRATLLGKGQTMVSSYVDALYGDAGDPATPEPPAVDKPALDPEACFVARLAADMTIATFKVNNGHGRLDGGKAVTQAIGLFEEAKRQLADVHSGKTKIVETTSAV